jgi:tetratricopeptide (TPR) repeat protein
MDLTYFNPNSQRESDFLMGFIARQRTLDFFLKQLGLVPAGGAARHYLIVAPRGFGKTSLLRRIAIGVRTDEQLNVNFIPLRFREEQHNVISLDVFWRNCLQSLAEAREDEGASPDEIAALDAAWDAHAPRQALTQDEQDGEPAWQVLHAHCERLQRRPLLLIDNLDTLLAGLSSHHQWGLRKRLQSDDGPVLIAAASRYPAATHDQAAAFYEFFRIQPLEKLNDQEVFSCLRNLAVHRGPAGQPVLTMLDKDPGRVAALNTMAGGNPRTLSVLYGVLESHKSADVLSQLNAMLDTFTGWYQARTEELPIQARAVFDALALNWDPMTAAALGLATGLDTPIISSQLTRLEKAGYVEPVALSKGGKGRSGYQVSERFFNIWYLMRNGPRRARQSILFLTKFLQSCFSPAERRSHAISILESGQSDPGYTLALASSFKGGLLRQQLLEQAYIKSNGDAQGHEYESIINELRAEGRRQPSAVASGPDEVERLIRDCDEIILRFGNAGKLALRERVAMALISKGAVLNIRGQSERAIVVYDDLLARFGSATEPALREWTATALINKGVALEDLCQSERAIAVYGDVLARFGAATEPVLSERVAMALVNMGFTLGVLGQSEQAIAAYDEVLARFGAATEPVQRELVAMALVNKGVTLGDLGQSEQAVAVYDDVLARYGAANELALRDRVAKAFEGKAFLLREGERLDASESTYRDAIEWDSTVPRFHVGLGNLLLDFTGDIRGALAAFQRGLETVAYQKDCVLLHANMAYAIALHDGDRLVARMHANSALEDDTELSPAGQRLLEALPIWNRHNEPDWAHVFEHIGDALTSDDPALWTNYSDDLQRILWFVLANGQGDNFKRWMADAQFQNRYAPLYHAFVAALEGEDHLLRINPETRQPAQAIYAGIVRRLKLWPTQKGSKKTSGRRREPDLADHR